MFQAISATLFGANSYPDYCQQNVQGWHWRLSFLSFPTLAYLQVHTEDTHHWIHQRHRILVVFWPRVLYNYQRIRFRLKKEMQSRVMPQLRQRARSSFTTYFHTT
jgi:hypothetical protein